MQELKTLLTLGDIIQERYMIKGVLGGGGFSTVYLVCDLKNLNTQDDGKNSLFALKELHSQGHQEKVRFAFEGELLEKLHHSALPHFYRIFKDTKLSQEFILLEYIQGPNLEVLRRQQLDNRFTLFEVLAIVQPIIEAVAYLHSQQPPVIHRDIKPANIIVSEKGKGAVLVDFGIAKEYETDATTTAVRHCSPGYGAPEQYSGYGTDPRTDIYGLGATCYTLLTGTIPADAFHRTTTLVSKKSDPLVPINNIVTNIPEHSSQAIERAMSISQDNRFSTVEDFWLALNTPLTEHGSLVAAAKTPSPLSDFKKVINQEIYQRLHVQMRHPQRQKSGLFISLCLAFLIIVGGGLSFWSYAKYNYRDVSISSSHISHLSKAPTLTPSPSTSYFHIKNAYRGTVHDLSTNSSTEMTLVKISQNNERINGSFTGLHLSDIFTGVLDSSQHIFFTIRGNTSRNPIFFEGAIRPDGILAGNYCDVDQTGQCTGDYGLWSVTPAAL